MDDEYGSRRICQQKLNLLLLCMLCRYDSAYRILQTALAALLLLTMLGAMFSGIVLSQYVFDFLPIRGGRAVARVVHLLCTYWNFLLMSLHIGLHWGVMMGVVHRNAGKVSSRIPATVSRLSAILIAIYGCIAFGRHDMLSYLLLRTHFVFFDFDRPLILFFADYLAVMGMFIFFAYYAGKFLRKGKSQRRKPD